MGRQMFLLRFLALAGLAIWPLLACGSSAQQEGTSTEATPIIARTAEIFTVDSFVNAGWKKSKEFSTETLPQATSVWYGFYSQRDVEIRFYDSHSDALDAGVLSAQAAVDRSPNSNIGGGIITSAGNRTQYNDFLVAGNVVVLCQQDIAPCEELVTLIP